MSIDEKFLTTIEKYSMTQQGDTVIVAVSGGADSMTLLRLFFTYKDILGVNIRVCHVNHGLRGQEADNDEKLVCDYCKNNKIQFDVLHTNIKEICQETHEGEEECGRRIRYEFFEKIAKGIDNIKIATAHTLSDKSETMVFNITRGCTISGVASIPPIRENIIRPLIEITRKEIESYCNENGIEFAVDKTNYDDSYSRNRIRLNAIPQLKQINPSFEQAVGRLCESAAVDDAFLKKYATEQLEKCEISENKYDVVGFANNDEAILSRMILMSVEKAGGSAGYSHIRDAIEVVKNGGSCNFIGNIRAENDGTNLKFGVQNEIIESYDFVIPFTLGEIIVPFGKIIIEENKNKDKIVQNTCYKINNLLSYNLTCDDIMCNGMVIRTRRPGDKITLSKRKVTKSLKKLFNEKKVPEAERNRRIVIADDRGVLWVEGIGSDARCITTGENTKTYRISVVIKNA